MEELLSRGWEVKMSLTSAYIFALITLCGGFGLGLLVGRASLK